MASLRLVPPSGPAIELTRDQNVVGRDPTCDVVLSDGSVSRRHARIEKRGTEWAVVDQGSANGTFVDSQRVAEVVLKNGQEVRFGGISFRVETGGAASAAGAPGSEVTVVAMPPPLPPRAAPPKPEPPRASPPPPLPRERLRASAPPSASPSPVPQMAAPLPPIRKGRGPFFWIATGCCGCLTLVLVLFGIIGGGVFLMTRGAVDAVQERLRDLKAGRVAEVYDGLAASYRARLSREDFERLVERHPGLRDNSQALFWPPVGSVRVDNDTAAISGVLVAASGERENVAFELRKEQGTWRISNIRFTDGEESSSSAPSRAVPPRARSMETETVELQKDPGDGGTRVMIKTRTRGFALREEAGGFRVDLVGDLETLGPGGSPIPGLSKPSFYTLNETLGSREGATADFKTDLTFTEAPPGRYVVRITIRDRIGGGRDVHRISFDLP